MQLSEADHARIADAISAAEAQTSGEIVCLLATDRHRYVEWLLGLSAVFAFLLPAIASLSGFGPSRWAALAGFWRADPFTEIETIAIYVAAQAILLIGVTLALWWSPVAQRYAPRAMRRERVHEMALKQFLARGIHLTQARTGVLIHVSAEDHIVEVIADEGIYARVSPDHWGETADALLAGLRRDDLAQGFVDAIALAGTVLAEHFPPSTENRDELPNRLVLV